MALSRYQQALSFTRWSNWCALLIRLLICSALGAVFQAQAAPVTWTGEWDSTWRHRAARVSLEQNGNRVEGVVPLYGTRFEAIATGRELRGQWSEHGREGSFVAIQAADGRTFTARFGTGEWATGVRVDATQNTPLQAIEAKSPANTLYHFLTIMNAVGPGRMELQSEASRFIDFSGHGVGSMSELDYTRLLYDVLNRLTIPRIWGLYPGDSGDTFKTQLSQAGSDKRFVLAFRKRNDHWLIDPPSVATLQRTLAELQLARPAPGPGRSSDRLSPRDTLRTLVESLDEGSASAIERAVSTLNLSNLSAIGQQYDAPRLARYINRALERLGALVWQEVPDDPLATEAYVHFEHPEGRIAIAPVTTDDGVVWQFTPDTLHSIRHVYAALDDLPPSTLRLVTPTPRSLYFEVRDKVRNISSKLVLPWGPMEVWQWLGLALSLSVALLLGWGGGRWFRQWSRSSIPSRKYITTGVELALSWSFCLLAVGVTLRFVDEALSFHDVAQVIVVSASWTCIVLAATTLALIFIRLVTQRIRERYIGNGHNATLVSLAGGVSRVAVILLAIALLADLLQVPYQGVLAGLGIGGLAVALAAQPTLQNFISGIILYFDKPIAVDDFCRFGERIGTVEYIGMRSTRIRTLHRTIVTIPNSEFSNMQIENFAKRDRMFLNPTLQLRYETTPDQLRFILAELHRVLLAHPKVAAEDLRVRLSGFGAQSFDIEVFGYILSVERAEFVAIREDIFLRFIQLVGDAGARFAIPAVVNYRSADPAVSDEKIAATEMQVQRWREEGNLPFPDFAWQDKAELRNTLDFPPVGSAVGDSPPEAATR